MTDAEPLGIEFDPEDFPHGLRCAECNRELKKGDRYSEKLDGMIGDTPTTLLICVPAR